MYVASTCMLRPCLLNRVYGGVCASAYPNPSHLPILSLDLYILSFPILSHHCTCLPTVDTCIRYKQQSSSSSLAIAICHSSHIQRDFGVLECRSKCGERETETETNRSYRSSSDEYSEQGCLFRLQTEVLP